MFDFLPVSTEAGHPQGRNPVILCGRLILGIIKWDLQVNISPESWREV
jgi:hypothetical protein